jgi:hypothetical protein
MSSPSYRIHSGRVPLAVVAGALVGGAFGALFLLLPDLARSGLPPNLPQSGLSVASFVGAMIGIGSVIFLFGIIIFATPLWVAFHNFGWRSWWVAALFGSVECFAIMMALTVLPLLGGGEVSSSVGGHDLVVNSHMTSYGWQQAFQNSTLFALAGALSGLAVWRVAYRRDN